MGLQSTVNLYPAIGMAGQQVIFGQADYTEENYISDGSVKAGQFALPGTAVVNPNGFAVPVATLADAAATSVLGFVEKVDTGYLQMGEDGSMVYHAGEHLTIAKNGEYYAEATGVAAVGQKVLVTVATGAMSYGSSAASGQVDTGWVVKKAAAAAGDIIIIAAHANA